MKLFGPLYDRAMRWSTHRHASRYLAGLSFAESSFFPVPPDVLLAPMVLARPQRGWWLAFLTTIASVLGGLLGYAIGWFALDLIEPVLENLGYIEAYTTATEWFGRYGFWAVLVAGFSPVPYKIFTIAAGVLNLAILPFVLASIIGRGARFYLLAWCLARFGPAIEPRLLKYIERIGWAIVVALLLAIAVYYV